MTTLNNLYTIFQKAAKNCSAYQQFLKQQNINTQQITAKTLDQIPTTTKHNYIQSYSLNQRIYNNTVLNDHYLITTTSGSTSEPTLFAKQHDHDRFDTQQQLNLLQDNFDIKHKSSLIVIAFSLGTTAAGLMTLKSQLQISKTHPTTIVTPGSDAQTAAALIQQLYQDYQQVICLGFPAIIDGIIQYGQQAHPNIHHWKLNICTTGQFISQDWIQTTQDHLGPHSQIIPFYANAEAGIIGTQTPLTQQLLTLAKKNPDLHQDLFQASITPTLVEINQDHILVEIIKGKIAITLDAPTPLIRFDMQDSGGILTKSQLQKIARKHQFKCNPTHDLLYVFGKVLSSGIPIHNISNILKESPFKTTFSHLFQYQESTNTLHVFKQALNPTIHKSIRIQLQKKLLPLFSDHPKLMVHHHDNIPTAINGKFPYILKSISR